MRILVCPDSFKGSLSALGAARAGGKGTRLELFTRIFPKPLIPIGEKPIIEHIMDNFSKFGFQRFLLSLNYKAEMIRLYFSEH